MGRPSSPLVCGALALFLASASALESCVQVSGASFSSSCPCDAGSEFTFQIEGQTTVTANTVNVAVIVDASGSVDEDELLLEKDFAKSAVASFASRNLFENGGTASYADFATTASEGATFDSAAEFDTYVDTVARTSGGTNIEAGLARGRQLLSDAPNATVSFLILITDGDWNEGGDPQIEADAARAEGTIVYAVGVGSVPEGTLLSIGGDPANVFDTSDFTELDSALDDIISESAGSVPCAATGAVITVEFNAVVTAASADGGSTPADVDGGNVVVFEVDNLEATPTTFEVVLDTCGEPEGAAIVASVSYTDAEANAPDLSSIEATGFVPSCGVDKPTPAPVDDPSYSYSYTFEPWYDDDKDSSDDGAGPGPAPHTVQPPSPVPESGMTCSNGVYGVESSNGAACCVAECGTCGGAGCSQIGAPDLGADDCCITEIVDFGKACSVTGVAPCYIDGDSSPVPSPTEGTPSSPMPTTPGAAPVSPGPAPTAPSPMPVGMTCSNGVYGVESSNGAVCCVAECGTCGGAGCSKFGAPDLGADDCCVTEIVQFGEACSETGVAPCYIDGDSPVSPGPGPTAPSPMPVGEAPGPVAPSPMTGMTCSNGIYGVESSNGAVCCDAGCGLCGGVGCSQFGAPALGADDCCISEIVYSGEMCAVTGIAPCIIDDGFGSGPAPTVSTPSPADDFSYSFSFSYAWNDDDETDEPTPAPITPPTQTPPPAPTGTGKPVTVTESFTVEVPKLDESSLDFGFLVDVSGSYSDDIVNLKLLAEDLVEGLAEDTADLELALGSFSDISDKTGIDGSEYTLVKPFGGCTDTVCYEQGQDDFVTAINTLEANKSGSDWTIPEAQTIALVRATEDWSWREGVLKVLAITTDAAFHVPGDAYSSGDFGDEYFTLDEVIDACNSKNIKILALKAPGAGDEMDTIATETGGVLSTTQANSEDIVDAVLQGLAGVQYSKVEVDWVCDDSSWTLTVDPSSGYDNVDGGAMLDFTVTVTVPAGVAAGTSCVANVLADEVLVGGQEFAVSADGSVTVTEFLP